MRDRFDIDETTLKQRGNGQYIDQTVLSIKGISLDTGRRVEIHCYPVNLNLSPHDWKEIFNLGRQVIVEGEFDGSEKMWRVDLGSHNYSLDFVNTRVIEGEFR